MKLFIRNLKPHSRLILFIIIGHIFQGLFTLMLPAYTSTLVDTGIQHKGFEYAVPLAMPEEVADEIYAHLDADERDLLGSYYDNHNLRTELKSRSLKKQEWKALEEIFLEPLALYQLQGASNVSAEEGLEQLHKQAELHGEAYIHNLAVQGSLALYEASDYQPETIQKQYLLSNGAKMLAVSVGIILSAVVAHYFSAQVGANVGRDLRSKIFDRVLTLSDQEIEKYSTASLITRTTNDIQQIQFTTTLMLRGMLFAPIIAIGGIIYIIRLQPAMSWVLLLSVTVILVFIFILFKLIMPRFRRVQALFDQVNLVAREILSGIQVVRAFGRQEYEEERFTTHNRILQDNFLFIGKVISFVLPYMFFILDASSILIVWVASHLIGKGQMQVGGMMAFISYSMQVLFSFVNLSLMSLMLPRSLVSLGRVQEVIDQPSSIQDPAEPLHLSEPKGRVAFEDVTFYYEDADAATVEEVNFTAEPGETTAIIGSTGSGKSTLLNLLLRFSDVKAGSITIDGVDIRDLSLEELRDLVALVPQKGYLFSGTIQSNIAYSDDQMPMEQVERAAEIAHATEFIDERPNGYRSLISQGGTNVSGGQKQRLSIARAIAKDPLIYLFDDSFSALDYRTDASLRKALKDYVGERATTIIVAQRISTILDADKIIVMDEGQVCGIGTHRELLEKSSVYQEIAKSQLSEDELYGKEGA